MKLMVRLTTDRGYQDYHVYGGLNLRTEVGEVVVVENDPGKPWAGYEVVVPTAGEVEILIRRYGCTPPTVCVAKIRTSGGERITIYGDYVAIVTFDAFELTIIGINWASEKEKRSPGLFSWQAD